MNTTKWNEKRADSNAEWVGLQQLITGARKPRTTAKAKKKI